MTDYAVMILAGGLGTRLRDAVPDRQKAVAMVGGEPFLARILRQVEKTEIREIILCVGYQSSSVKELLQIACPDLALKYSLETHPLGTGGALRQALDLTKAGNLLVLNGDSFLDTSLIDFLRWYKRRNCPAALLLTETDNASRYGSVTLADDDLIAHFTEKDSCPRPGLINAGIYLLRREIILSLPASQQCSLERDLFPRLAEQKQLCGRLVRCRFIDIGTPESYVQAQTFFNFES